MISKYLEKLRKEVDNSGPRNKGLSAFGLIAAGVAAGAGSIGAAAIGNDSGSVAAPTAGAGAKADPASAFATFDALLDLGIVDTSILFNASPLQQAITTAIQNNPEIGKRNEIIQSATAAFGRWKENPNQTLRELVTGPNDSSDAVDRNVVGLTQLQITSGNISQLFEQEVAFRAKVEPLAAKLGATADQIFESRIDARIGITQLQQNLPDFGGEGIEGLKGQELARLIREIDRNADLASGDILRRANIGGFNPGRALGELERVRFDSKQDADLVALGRALSLIGGQQTLVSNQFNVLSGILGQGRDQINVQTQLRNQAPIGGNVSQTGSTTNPLAAGIQGAGTAISETIQAFEKLKAAGPAE